MIPATMNPRRAGSRWGTIALSSGYAAGAMLVLALAWLPVSVSIEHFLYDDFFYYLTCALNLVSGNGLTLDGVEPTNGFHPLWMAILIVVQAVSRPQWSVHLALTLAALLHLAQVRILFQILSRRGVGGLTHFLCLFYLFNYRIIACNLCGLETPLALFFFLLAVREMLDAPPEPDRAYLIRFGAVLGLACLARFDLLLFAGCCGVWLFLHGRDRLSLSRRLRGIALAASVSVALMLPWFIWSYSSFHRLLPATIDSARLVGEVATIGMERSFDQNATILVESVRRGTYELRDSLNLLGLFPEARSPRVNPALEEFNGSGFLILLAALLPVAHLFPGGERGSAPVRRLLAIFAALHLGYYGLFSHLEVRYLLPSLASVLILFGFSIQDLWVRSRHRLTRVSIATTCVVLSANMVLAGRSAWVLGQGATNTHFMHRDLWRTAAWVRESLPPGSVIGSWNAGILSYYSGRRVVNLDGVINERAHQANLNRDLWRYIEQREIDYLAEFGFELNRFMPVFGGNEEWRAELEMVHREGHVVVVRRKARPHRPPV